MAIPVATMAQTGSWSSKVTGSAIRYKASNPANPRLDYFGKFMTVVYLENLPIEKIGRIKHKKNVAWLLSQGYRVIELDYGKHPQAVSPNINQDIIAINDSLASGTFCGQSDCSSYRCYVLFEGYRLAQDVPYFVDDPTVYNSPKEYTIGDTLRMDIIYPVNPKVAVPVILSFSYSNSYASWNSDEGKLDGSNQNQRLKLSYTVAGFDDSFQEGAPARGMAWAIADHPKYCQWGKGKTADGPNDGYKSFQTNPDAAQKVKSAIRTLRAFGKANGLSDKIGIYGFSRGSTAGSLAIGDRRVAEFENAGFHLGTNDEVQAAALGPGVFDYTIIYDQKDDGDKNLELRCPWVWGPLDENRANWEQMGSSWLVETKATAPVLFFYNTTDEAYYQEQLAHLRAKLNALGVDNSAVIDYGKGHSVPTDAHSLEQLYNFFGRYLKEGKREKGGKGKR